jgi:hypothetical protein
MQETVASPLAAWESFYVIVGSSAGALTGLMFVVITLIAETGTPGDSVQADNLSVAAFGTPTVVHFCAVLFLSGVLSAPWRDLTHPAVLLGATGIAGVIYTMIVVLRARRQRSYQPVFEDWLFHVLLPLAGYAMLAGSAFAARSYARPALFVVGAAALLLLFVGIHNAWDTVTHLVFVQRRRQREDERDRSG